ncbi:hypothetical protein DPMN_064657 [Dreissena polymorpha]|uniref:Uncharacterized protein n=1 Tax=Dreissena polymorpha TaxID=45954 RepID=A0A9D4CE73_DREPO|nr:hypothetical protein DPMN_064657 [Dreissena polymorpha]
MQMEDDFQGRFQDFRLWGGRDIERFAGVQGATLVPGNPAQTSWGQSPRKLNLFSAFECFDIHFSSMSRICTFIKVPSQMPKKCIVYT